MMCEARRRAPRYDAPGKRWKETLFKKCMASLKERRQRQFDKRRGIDASDVSETVQEQAMILQNLAEGKASQDDNLADWKDEDLNAIELEIMDALETELWNDLEYAAIWESTEAEDVTEEIARDLSGLELYHLNREDQFVLCPVCVRDSLRHSERGLVCSCGVLLEAELWPELTIAMVKWQLDQVYSLHNSHLCAENLQCRYRPDMNGSRLIFTCENCMLDCQVPRHSDSPFAHHS